MGLRLATGRLALSGSGLGKGRSWDTTGRRWVHDHAAGWRLVPVRGLEQLIRRLLFEAHRDCHGDLEETGAVPRRAVAPCLLALRALRGGSPLPQVPTPARAGLRRLGGGGGRGRGRGLAGGTARPLHETSLARPDQARHRRCRVAPETCLKHAHDRLTYARERGLRRRHRPNPVHHILRP